MSRRDTTPHYAKGTTVPIENSKAELDRLLGKHGAGQRGLMHDEERGLATVVFSLGGRPYRVEVPIPSLMSPDTYAPGAKVWPDRPPGWTGWAQSRREEWVRKQHEQAARERWRGLVLLVKAKLEIVKMGVSTFEREFLADLVLPSQQTVSQHLEVYMAKVLKGEGVPLALPEAVGH